MLKFVNYIAMGNTVLLLYKLPTHHDFILQSKFNYLTFFLSFFRIKSIYKPTSGTRKCNCRHEMRTEQMGAGRFQMYQIKVCDECPNVVLAQETRSLEVIFF